MIRNIIFDWSGTLVDDLPAVLEATNHVFREIGRPELTVDQFRDEFVLPFERFYERFTPGVPIEQLERLFHGKFREVQGLVSELPHAREFLEFCRGRKFRTFVLSTMHAEHFSAQADRYGFGAYLERPYLGVWDKRTKIRELLTENGLAPEETLFIGDMPHDVETARHGGVRSCAVLTGYGTLRQLRSSSPDMVVEHLGELRRILEREVGVDSAAAAGPGGTEGRYPICTVGALVFNEARQVLMVRTRKWSNLWGIPGGKIQWGERSEDALRREIREETGLEIERIRFVLVQDCIRSTEFHRPEHFVLLNYTCQRLGAAEVTLNHEAQAYKWATLQEAWKMELNGPTRVLLDALFQGTAL